MDIRNIVSEAFKNNHYKDAIDEICKEVPLTVPPKNIVQGILLQAKNYDDEYDYVEMIIQLVSRASHQTRNKLNFLFNLFFYVVNAGNYCDFEKSQHGVAV